MPLPPAELARIAVTLLVGAALLVSERRTGHMPNWLTLAGWAIGILTAFAFGRGVDAILGTIVLAVPAFLLFRVDALGGGGVKSAMAMGACVGVWASGVIAAVGGFMMLIFFLRYKDAETRPRFRSSPALLGLALSGLAVNVYLQLR